MTQPAVEDAPSPRLHIRRLQTTQADSLTGFAEDVRAGLTSSPKYLFPKYFYDELGSQLFDAICLLPEYYLTRAETEVLAEHSDEIRRALVGERVALLELGSGSAVKTRSIIDALLRRQTSLLYIPIDISPSALETSARALLQSYPSLRIDAYASDYDSALEDLRRRRDEAVRERLLALFLGSNIGNFDREEARRFLRTLRAVLRPDDALLVGVDLKKSSSLLEAAYDDALGVTAAFNLNLLARINRELDADFDPRAFRHVAFYNEAEGRIEIYIESRRAQSVRIRSLDLRISFADGERIHTENSYKYDLPELARLASETGFTLARTWLDRARRFSSNLFVAVE
ncbi:MAG TPA: L-histidine N(alpha)-methyltransferase [Pyrinomonadaceae bacterium]|jgi:dimethylhistidine N-methyltransferase